MREIKFRIWLGGRFYYWGFIKSDFNDDYEFRGIADTNAEPLTMTEKMKRSQQYTGLKDKNGVEIYEGDIIGVEDGDFEVCFLEFCWYLRRKSDSGLSFGRLNETWLEAARKDLHYEVIGNIWENPELLKEVSRWPHK